MTEENLDLSRRAAEAFNRRDVDGFLALQHEDVKGFPLASDMVGGYCGHEGTRRWWDSQFDSFPDLTIEIVEMTDPGDVTIAELRMRGTGAGGAVPVDTTIWRASRWRDGKCTWWGTFRTEADALAAVADLS